LGLSCPLLACLFYRSLLLGLSLGLLLGLCLSHFHSCYKH
jgi:hypothetical protein